MSEDATAVLVPMLNPNEPEAVLVERLVQEGQAVTAGDVLCVVETTKSTDEVVSEVDGYVVGWRAAPSEQVTAGEVLCHVASSPTWSPPPPPETGGGAHSLPAGLRISRPALALALEWGVALERLPLGPMVTVATVQSLLGDQPAPAQDNPDGRPPAAFDPTALVVYGGSGHGRTLVELVRAGGGLRVVGIVDRGLTPGHQVLGVPVLGGDESLAGVRSDGVALAANGVGGVARATDRVGAFRRLTAAGFAFPILRHPSAVVEPSSTVAAGAQVMAHAYVGSEARVGLGAIVNTGAVVSHDCRLSDHVNLSPGATLAGEVQVGGMTLIGMGATVNIGVKVGARVRIGNGAVVKADVPDDQIVRAGTTWPA